MIAIVALVVLASLTVIAVRRARAKFNQGSPWLMQDQEHQQKHLSSGRIEHLSSGRIEHLSSRGIELGSMKIVDVNSGLLSHKSLAQEPLSHKSLAQELRRIVGSLPADARVGGKFDANVLQLVLGVPKDSVMPIAYFMCVPEDVVLQAQSSPDGGLRAIEAEFMQNGTTEDKECYHYIRYGKTGDSERRWPNGILDEGREAGLTLEWFMKHQPKAANLSLGMIIALRLYTTACYKSINNPLRGLDGDGKPRELNGAHPHPLPVTVHLLTEGIKRLRSVEAESSSRSKSVTLWRGLRSSELPNDFMEEGGSEKAPMSTTHSLEVAIKYSASTCSVLVKLETSNFLVRGADLTFLSAFPGECEVLFPPLTYLMPIRKQEVMMDDGISYTVVEVNPQF